MTSVSVRRLEAALGVISRDLRCRGYHSAMSLAHDREVPRDRVEAPLAPRRTGDLQRRLRAETLGFGLWGVAGGAMAFSYGLDRVGLVDGRARWLPALLGFVAIVGMLAIRFPLRLQWVGVYSAAIVGGLVWLGFSLVPPVSFLGAVFGIAIVLAGRWAWLADGARSALVRAVAARPRSKRGKPRTL